jgi:adenosylmethionine-8-amino-7-oxononanoate aminotransferase
MTKTTNFEISKKLAEIGFKKEAEKCWAKIRHSVSVDLAIETLRHYARSSDPELSKKTLIKLNASL